MDLEAILTGMFYLVVIGVFIFSLVHFIKNIRKSKEERSIWPTVFFIIMTFVFSATVAFVAFIINIAYKMKLNM